MKYIVGCAWVEDRTVVSHLVVSAPSEDRVRAYAKYAWYDHVVVSVEPHWDQTTTVPATMTLAEDAEEEIRKAIESELNKL
jgi:triosephosphate isomerase